MYPVACRACTTVEPTPSWAYPESGIGLPQFCGVSPGVGARSKKGMNKSQWQNSRKCHAPSMGHITRTIDGDPGTPGPCVTLPTSDVAVNIIRISLSWERFCVK